jgi:hypothetical protein
MFLFFIFVRTHFLLFHYRCNAASQPPLAPYYDAVTPLQRSKPTGIGDIFRSV